MIKEWYLIDGLAHKFSPIHHAGRVAMCGALGRHGRRLYTRAEIDELVDLPVEYAVSRRRGSPSVL